MKKFQYTLLYTSILIAFSSVVSAEEVTNIQEEQDSTTLDTVEVKALSFSQQVGTQKINEQQIARRPTKGGGITDLLKSNPNVRFSNNADLSTNAGEIAPNEVSFHGEKYYNNNFILDGMSNNDNINPSGNIERNGVPVGSTAYDLPNGNSQSMWIDAALLKSIEVFDSNVSAKYGHFTGGVVEAKLKDPSFERRTGKIYYRTTRDDWTKFYIQEGKDEEFKNATRLDLQPKFVKQTFGIQASEKLAENFALLFSYERTQSDIDHYHRTMRYKSDVKKPVGNQQRRLNETYLLRGVYLPENGDLWRGTLIYSPHQSRLFKQNVKNGQFTATGGGLQANVEWEKNLDWGKVSSYVGYKQTGDEIKHEHNDYHRYVGSRHLDWYSNVNGTLAAIGGFGKYFTNKEIYTFKQDYNLTNFDWKETEHNISFGWKADFARAKYERDGTSTSYFYEPASNVICSSADNCLNGDQYAATKNVYTARRVKTSDTDYAAYLQDTIKWKNLELTLGARLSHNVFLGNTDLAHRISGSYDLFGDQSTMLFGGFNRYYGTSMLAYRLRQGIGTNDKYTRTLNTDGTLSDWGDASLSNNAPTKYYHTKVKTPYSDEKVLGITQRALDTNWTIKWVHRNSRDQFSSSTRVIDGMAYRVLNNEGKTANDTFTLSVSPLKAYEWKYAVIGWDAGARISSTKTNSKNYDTSTDLTEKAIYNGKLIDAVELPPSDFNTPWTAFVNVNMHFPTINLSWDHRFSYTHGRKTRVSDDTVSCNGQYSGTVGNYAACGNYVGDAKVYEDLEMGSSFNIDWRFTYKQPTFQNQFLELTLDINNVLNRKELSRSTKSSSVYKQGRNFWLGASYNW